MFCTSQKLIVGAMSLASSIFIVLFLLRKKSFRGMDAFATEAAASDELAYYQIFGTLVLQDIKLEVIQPHVLVRLPSRKALAELVNIRVRF